MTFQILLCCIDTLRGPYNDLDSFLFLLEAVSFILRLFPTCVLFGPLHDPCPPCSI